MIHRGRIENDSDVGLQALEEQGAAHCSIRERTSDSTPQPRDRPPPGPSMFNRSDGPVLRLLPGAPDSRHVALSESGRPKEA